ncbi:VanZ family protein [Celeribacter neptunius]|uniref:VanZ like family protein n=1 Tax=Celeribacter neptunius TaxID=588602 RepID=A0A1I3SC32_9RHOB|nr:VanZ family protein [Celeribacter neptunius]SFJ56288.1 VanZ like family protein [Celeribacter neptunius]
MSLAELISYLGLGSTYALGLALIAWGLLWYWRGGGVAFRDVIALFPAFFFVILTQYPFPDPASLDCSQGGVAPILRPFAVMDYFVRLVTRVGADWRHWIGHKVVQATVLNFALCVLVGIGFSRFLRSVGQITLAGFGLSLAVEICQLTGTFGLYPCPYRTFEVDDLILNTAGAFCGALLARRYRARTSTR